MIKARYFQNDQFLAPELSKRLRYSPNGSANCKQSEDFWHQKPSKGYREFACGCIGLTPQK